MKNRAHVFSTTILLLVAAAAASAQQPPQGPPPAQGRGNMGRPIVLGPDDVRAFPDAPAGFNRPRARRRQREGNQFAPEKVAGFARFEQDLLDNLIPAIEKKYAALTDREQGVHVYLKERDVPHIWNVDDEGHTPKTWAGNLYHFARRIFR